MVHIRPLFNGLAGDPWRPMGEASGAFRKSQSFARTRQNVVAAGPEEPKTPPRVWQTNSPSHRPRDEAVNGTVLRSSAASVSGLPQVPLTPPRPPRKVFWQFRCQTCSKDGGRKRENAGKKRRRSSRTRKILKRQSKLCICGSTKRCGVPPSAEKRAEAAAIPTVAHTSPLVFWAAYLRGVSETAWPFTCGSAR